MGWIMSNEFRILVAVDLKTGTDQLLAEAQRYGHALNATVDVIHVAEPDPDFVGYIKSDHVEKPTQEDLIRDGKANDLRSEHQQTQTIGATLRTRGVRVDQALTVQGPVLGNNPRLRSQTQFELADARLTPAQHALSSLARRHCRGRGQAGTMCVVSGPR